MGWPVVTVAAGGIPVIDVTATKPGLGVPVTEAANKFGVAVTKVAVGGIAVTFETIGVGGGTTYATWDGPPANGAVVSNGGLTITHTSGTNNAGVNSTTFKTAGKNYFEIVIQVSTNNTNGLGIMPSGKTYSSSDFTTFGTVCMLGGTSSIIHSNGASTLKDLGATVPGDIFGVAIDLTARLAWIRKNGGLWNGDGAANPATAAGGVTIAAASGFSPAVRLTGTINGTDAMTANFGASAFSGAVPSGFTSGWPV